MALATHRTFFESNRIDMNGRNPQLTARIESALDNTPSPELVFASLGALARASWDRYCGDAEARRMCRMVATSEMTALHLERCDMEMPAWAGDVGGIAHLAVVLDAAAGRARDQEEYDALAVDRNVLVDGLLVPIRNYTIRNRAARERNRAEQALGLAGDETSRPKRRSVPQYDFTLMARRYCKNELKANEARALFHAFFFSTARGILRAVESSSAFSEDAAAAGFKRYSAHAVEALKQTRDCSAEVLCEDWLNEQKRIQEEGCEDEEYEDLWELLANSPEELPRRLFLPLFFEPLALVGRYGGDTASGRVKASPNPTLSARLAAA